MIRLLLLLIGYGCGLLQTGYLIGKLQGVDIRTKGSGNSGATNTLRVLGVKSGVLVLAGDVLKCMIPCLIVRSIYKGSNPDMEFVAMLWLALGCILGHNYPCYLGFRGGKGISSTAGFILAFDLRISAVCASVFLLIVFITRYVSLGSLVVVTLNLILGVVFWRTGLKFVGPAYGAEYTILLILITALAFWRHRANIKRLLEGTERKIGHSEKK